MISKILSLFLLGIAVIFTSSQAARADLVVGISVDAYPPFSVRDSEGNWQGWEIDFIKSLCQAMHEKCEIRSTAWDGLIPSLTTGKIDLIISSMAITPKRQEVIDFSRPYYNSSSLMVGTVAAVNDLDPAHLQGKKIGVQTATIYAEYAEKHYGQQAEIVLYQNQDQAWQDMAVGRIDLSLAEAVASKSFLGTDPTHCCLIAFKLNVGQEMGLKGVGVGMKKGNDRLVRQVNTAITELLGNKTLQKLSEKYGISGLLDIPQP